ncbi:Prostaglandin reductase 3 [Aphanomyces cochlioides]|nr:Prostaglandin reductase 3 [Aphanomyces cochlioides]
MVRIVPGVATIAALSSFLIDSTEAMFRFDCFNEIVMERMSTLSRCGGNGFSLTSGYDELVASSCTSCPIGADKSAYWVPALYAKYKNGTGYGLVKGHQIVYYEPRGQKGEKVHALPKGLKILAGDPSLRTYNDSSLAQQAITWQCLDYSKSYPQTPGLPTTRCPDGLRGQVNFPMCWNGKDLDSPNHKDHMAYSESVEGGKCPSTHPIKVVKLFYELFFSVKEWDSEWAGDQHPFVLSHNDPTGYGFHGDFLNGWDVDVLQAAVDQCADENFFDSSKCPPLAPSFSKNAPTKCTAAKHVNEPIDHVAALPGYTADGKPITGPTTSPSSAPPAPSTSAPTPSTSNPATSKSPVPSTSSTTSKPSSTLKPSTIRPSAPTPAPSNNGSCSELGTGSNYVGNDVGSIGGVSDPKQCCTKCTFFANAIAFTHAGNTCYCKGKKGTVAPQGGATSGVFKTLAVTDPSACSELVDGVNFSLNDVGSIGAIFVATECCSKCKTFANAKAFTHAGTTCYCKSKKGTSESQGGATSGVIA